ncbi:hypothetical protein ON058_01835 [Demequina sp. B12]|uniref:hypothetical protein n=1 Tax=Demequina sp. B12 TaxID=2992757 RepID=UPI00237B2848|nr:hypothetical protein [Demequina sp. B12]MDE0572151.1 hypothetical protein [Demequina sp. B12]
MTYGAVAAIVVMAAVAWGTARAVKRRHTRAIGWPWALIGVLALGPVLYPPYTPLGSVIFEFSNGWWGLATWVAIAGTWLWVTFVTVERRGFGAPVAHTARVILVWCGQVWIWVLVIAGAPESGETPGFFDSWTTVALWVSAVAAVVCLAILALRKVPAPELRRN